MPDFVIVHPANGLLVLEVKDWRMDTIASASDVELVTTSGSVRTTSPFEQARGYMFEVMKLIQATGSSSIRPGTRIRASRSCLSGMASYSRISRAGNSRRRTCMKSIPEGRCVFKEEMSESVDAEVFRTRPWKILPLRIGSALTLPQFDSLRALPFPRFGFGGSRCRWKRNRR
jgi:hypothetical protein